MRERERERERESEREREHAPAVKAQFWQAKPSLNVS